MIYKKTITNFIARLSQLVELGASKSDFTKSNKLPKRYFEDTYENISNHYKEGMINKEDMDKINELWSKTSCPELPFTQETAAPMEESTSDDTTLEQVQLEADDDRNSVNLIRDEDGKIKFYEFKVLRKDKAPLTGRLTRDEMNNIHRMYSYYGMSITQREISRYFPEYSLIDFKRILRVFSITKAVSPFAPHIIEEHTQEELADMQMREKENDFLRTIEEQSVKNDRLLLKKYALENIELKRKLEEGIHIDLDGLNLTNLSKYSPKKSCGKQNIIIYLSDMHIGAYVSPLSIYSNPYNKEEVGRRLRLIADELFRLNALYGGFNNIYVCNLGDSLDGYDGQTTRGGHSLPQNMCNKEQIHTFIECMVEFFDTLNHLNYNEMKYICVGESNHDGDFGYAANVALEAILTHKGVDCTIFDKFIGEFNVGDTTFVLCHGKDNKDMFKNLPLTLDVKTENFINEYLDNKQIFGNKVVFVKGDLHQSATTYGRRFTYKSVGSLFGSSEWIHKNFGNTPACTDYSIIDGTKIIDGRIVLQ